MRRPLTALVTGLALSLCFAPWLTAGTPQRIVSLSLMTDEFLLALVPPQRIAALTPSADDPVLSNVTAEAKAVTGRTGLNLERLLSLKPDLVLAASWSPAADLAWLKARGIPVTVVAVPGDWAGVKAGLNLVAAAVGETEKAARLAAGLEARLARLQAKIARGNLRPAVLEYNLWGTAGGRGTLWDSLCRTAGLDNAAAGLKVDQWGYAPLSRELVLKLDPQWIIVPEEGLGAQYGSVQDRPQWRQDPLLSRLQAVRQGRVQVLPERLKSTASHWFVAAAEALFVLTHPGENLD